MNSATTIFRLIPCCLLLAVLVLAVTAAPPKAEAKVDDKAVNATVKVEKVKRQIVLDYPEAEPNAGVDKKDGKAPKAERVKRQADANHYAEPEAAGDEGGKKSVGKGGWEGPLKAERIKRECAACMYVRQGWYKLMNKDREEQAKEEKTQERQGD